MNDDKNKKGVVATPTMLDIPADYASAMTMLSEVFLQHRDMYIAHRALQQRMEEQAPKVHFVDEYVESAGLESISAVSSLLLARRNAFIRMLERKHVMYRGAGPGSPLVAYKEVLLSGYMIGKISPRRRRVDYYFTRRGIPWVSSLWEAYEFKHEVIHRVNSGAQSD